VAVVRPAALARFLLFGGLPFAICIAIYEVAGSGREFILWTVIVPFRDYGGRTGLPINAAQIPWVTLGFLPLAALLAIGPRSRNEGRSSNLLLLLLTFGFTAM